MLPESLLNGDNAAFLDQQYTQWLADPQSVEPVWRELFEEVGTEGQNGAVPRTGPSFRPSSIFGARGASVGAPVAAGDSGKHAKVVQLINSYRVRGHMWADIDPLQRRDKVEHPELTLGYYGLTGADLETEFPTAPLFGMPPKAKLKDILFHLRETYCKSIAAEFMNIPDIEQKVWVQQQLESLPSRSVTNKDEELRILRKLSDAENFERMLHTRFPGTKRFSLEGGETLIPLLDLVIEHSGAIGIRELVIGMAHRGRLNTLVNILEKPAHLIVAEFQDVEGITQGSGDVKYHKGYSADVTTVRGDPVHLSLTPNPSHLEAVNPVVEGRVRAKQDRTDDEAMERTMALLIHGDAAFAGQGTVSEVLNLSEVDGYRTGGTLHIIVNNQIGFTTAPNEGRSTPYATDVARMLGVPIFHVNGEDPRAVAAVVEAAVKWRQKYHRDVIIDMYCYRLHGHNEGDEPSYTQPLMYEAIRRRPTPRKVYADHLVGLGLLTTDDCERVFRESFEAMQDAAGKAVQYRDDGQVVGLYGMGSSSKFARIWDTFKDSEAPEPDTRVDADELRNLLTQANTLPAGFAAHVKVKRLLKQRMQMINGERGMDWSMGEQAAWASLLTQGHGVRLSGQDCGRGTFSHRHAVVTDSKTGQEFFPMRQLAQGQARFDVIDSTLSEAGVLGFECGYSLDMPETLVMWEAQFGDFANGAQVIIDQFIVASEQKWGRLSGLVMLLPHGYEGQGPEHSSARMERFLQMCAEENIQVANVTTPAQYFHMMRRQAIWHNRKPLVVMTPKKLLRHPLATSTLEDFATGQFHRVLPESDDLDPKQVKRVVLCSGKIYYELLEERRERGITDVALVRVEMLYPFPKDAIANVLAAYPGAEVVWAQEEPRNMGGWSFMALELLDQLDIRARYVGRPPAASPATGSHKKHKLEHIAVMNGALTFQD